MLHSIGGRAMPLMPPLQVRNFYKDAVLEVRRFIIDPIDINALKNIEKINNKIKAKSNGDKEWVIKIGEISK